MSNNAKGDVRMEKDTFGPIDVPADKLWGAQTQRSLQNFKISTRAQSPELITALAIVKQAAADVNAELGVLDPRQGARDRRRRPTKSSPASTTASSRSSSGRPAAARRRT